VCWRCVIIIDGNAGVANTFRGLLPLGCALPIAFGRVATILVSTSMLFHVILASEGFIALRAEGILLARVLFRVTRSMSRGGEVVTAVVLLGQWARVRIFLCLLLRWTL
jgi:hypothetical protein